MRKLALLFTLIMIFTIPWESAITFTSIGTITRLIGLGAAGIWVISVLVRHKLRSLRPYHILVFIFMLYNVASIFWTIEFDLTWVRVYTYAQLAIFTWLLWDLIDTKEALQAAMQVFILGGYIAVASAILNFMSGQFISDSDIGRYTGAGQNAVEFAMILSISLPMAWQLASTRKEGFGSNFLRVINFAYIPAALFAIILTASRTGLFGIVPGLLYIVATMGRVKFVYRFMVLVVFVSALIIGQALVPQITLNRLSTIGASIASEDLGGRVSLWYQSAKVFIEHPILGIGSGSLAAPALLGTFAHNTFLSILTELGLLGFIQFMAIFAIVVYQAYKQPRPYSIFWLVVFSIWVISINSLTWEYTKITWFILNMIILSAGVYSQENNPETSSLLSKNPFSDRASDLEKPNTAAAHL